MKVLLVLMSVSSTFAAHCTVHIYRAELDYDKDFLKVDYNFSMYQNSTIQNPVDVVPEIKVTLLKPVTEVAFILQGFINATSKFTINQKMSFCSTKSNRGGLFKAIIQVLMEIGKVRFRCSHIKGEKFYLRKFRVRDVPLSRLYPKCTKEPELVTVKVIEDKKVQHELMSVRLEMMPVDVPRE